MSATANTILSSIIGFTLGVLAGAAWYSAHKKTQKEEHVFDERDIYTTPVRKINNV